MIKYRCTVCGYLYDPGKGDAAQGVPVGVPFEDIRLGWLCPVCGGTKDDFSPW
ncbi:MAG: rubredoxin [Nitrospirae bacterium]|nr:rubredoxin [Nitrospirota bacterium]